MRRPHVIMFLLSLQDTGRRCRCSSCCELGIMCVHLLTTEEATATRASGIIIGRRRTITLLFLVVSDQEELDEGGDEEKGTKN